MTTRIKLRRDTAANWVSNNPILALGETGFETDTRMMKLGDGATNWNNLKYAVTGDMRITGTEIASDTAINFSSHSGTRKNWALTVNAMAGPGMPANAYIDAVGYDSMGNAFAAGWYSDIAGSFLIKLDPTGQVLWNNYYDEYYTYGWGVSVDHDGNAILILSEDDSHTGGSEDIVMIKVNGETGVPIWQRYLASVGDYDDYATSIDIDANNDIFIGGWTGADGINNGNETFLIAKINGTNGTFTGGWQKMITADQACNTEMGWGIAVDPMGDVCIVGNDWTGGPAFIPVAKRNGTTGAAIWQTRILDQLSWKGNVYTNWQINCSDVTSDSQGDFYVTWWGAMDGTGPGFPITTCGVTKLSGSDGKPMWSKQIGWPDTFDVAGSIVCDSDDNIYVHTNIESYQSTTNDSSGRFNSVIVKLNAQGTMIWSRTLRREQFSTEIGFVPGVNFPPTAGGQTVAVNDEYLLIGGTQFITLDYSDQQDYYNQPYLVQVDKEGTEFSVDGWHFEASPADIVVTPVTPEIDNQQYFNDLLTFNGTLTNTNANDVYHETNTDTTDLSYKIMPRAETMTFEGNKLTLPEGGSVDIPRKKLGHITSVGQFDGTEGLKGGNQEGDVWFDGVVRDSQGNSYVAGSHYNYGNFNDSGHYIYNNVPILFKIDSNGKIVWQASDSLDYYSEAVDVMINPVTNNPVVLTLDDQQDGTEGFTVKTIDANSGLVVGDVIHVQDEGNDNWLWARNLALMSDGTPVVVGYINSNKDEYLNVTSDGAGLTGSNATDTLVIPKSVFEREGGHYPSTNGLWYISNPSPYISSLITEVNFFANNGYGFTATNVSSSGSDASFTVKIDPATGAYTIVLVNTGSGYSDNDTLLIPTLSFLGVADQGDVAITVTGTDGGTITSTTATSTSTWANIELKINGTYDFTTATSTLKVYEETGDDGFIWTPNWNVAVGAQTGTDYFHSLALDTDDNVIVGGYYNLTGLPVSPNQYNWNQTSMLVKFSSTGTQQWAVSLDGSEGYGMVTGIVTDPDNNIYAMKQWTNDGANFLLKLDPDGNMLWQVALGYNRYHNGGDHGIAIDEDRNILIGGQYYGDLTDDREHGYNNSLLLNKFDTDGNLLWSRLIYSRTNSIYNGYNDDYRNSIDIHGDRFSIIGYSQAVGNYNYNGFFADLPLDGSGTGHYNDFIYEAVEVKVDRTSVIEENLVSPFTAEIREHGFTSTNISNVLTIYTDRYDKVETVYEEMGAEITSVNKIVFEDGTEQSTTAQDIPQVPMSRVNGDNHYILRLEDRGHHVYSGTQHDWSYVLVPRNSDVPFPIGTAITIVSGGWGDVVIGAQHAGNTTIWGAGTGNSNDGWWIPTRSMATLIKIEQDAWMLAGASLGTGRYW